MTLPPAPRDVPLSVEAAAGLRQLLGIVIDQAMGGESWEWDLAHAVELDQLIEDRWTPEEWLALSGPEQIVPLTIADASFLLDAMAFTEMASAEFPWAAMVRWTTEFVTTELRRPWSDAEWSAFRPPGAPLR